MDSLIEKIMEMDERLRHLDNKVEQNRQTLNKRLEEINENRKRKQNQNHH